jgi:uncharacterized protein YdcH (DUF465 family)
MRDLDMMVARRKIAEGLAREREIEDKLLKALSCYDELVDVTVPIIVENKTLSEDAKRDTAGISTMQDEIKSLKANAKRDAANVASMRAKWLGERDVGKELRDEVKWLKDNCSHFTESIVRSKNSIDKNLSRIAALELELEAANDELRKLKTERRNDLRKKCKEPDRNPPAYAEVPPPCYC